MWIERIRVVDSIPERNQKTWLKNIYIYQVGEITNSNSLTIS